MIVYEFLYCPCIYESGWVTMSIHRTKKGAYKAMKEHKLKEYEEFVNNMNNPWMLKSDKGRKFGKGVSWRISEKLLQD